MVVHRGTAGGSRSTFPWSCDYHHPSFSDSRPFDDNSCLFRMSLFSLIRRCCGFERDKEHSSKFIPSPRTHRARRSYVLCVLFPGRGRPTVMADLDAFLNRCNKKAPKIARFSRVSVSPPFVLSPLFFATRNLNIFLLSNFSKSCRAHNANGPAFRGLILREASKGLFLPSGASSFPSNKTFEGLTLSSRVAPFPLPRRLCVILESLWTPLGLASYRRLVPGLGIPLISPVKSGATFN